MKFSARTTFAILILAIALLALPVWAAGGGGADLFGFTSGQVLFGNGSAQGGVTQDAGLSWNNTSKTLTATNLTVSTTLSAGSGLAATTPASDNATDLGSSSKQWRKGYFGTILYSPSLDVASAGALTIGATTATSIALSAPVTLAANKGITATTGTGAFDLGSASGIFSTPTGKFTHKGAVEFAADKGVSTVSGTGAFDFSNGSGVFKTSTGANQLSGTTTLAADKNLIAATGTSAFDFSAGSGSFKTSTGDNTLSGHVYLAADKNLAVQGAGTSAIDFSNGTGVFKTTTGAVTLGGATSCDKAFMHKVSVITFATPSSLNPALGNVFTFSVTGDVTLNAAAAGTAGQVVTLIITGDGSARVITLGTNFKKTGTFSTAADAGKQYTMQFVSDGSNLIEVSRCAAGTGM